MLVVVIGTSSLLTKYAKVVAQSNTVANSIAEGAVETVQVVQALDAFDALSNSYQVILVNGMWYGAKKAITGAIRLGSILRCVGDVNLVVIA